jgi:hypothetical protein
MVWSQTRGELQLVTEVMTVLFLTNSLPKTILAMATVSSARSLAVTEPMNGLSECFRQLWTVCRWRFGTGTSTGSQVMPPDMCRAGIMWASL